MMEMIYPTLKETVRIKKMSSFCWVSELFSDSGTILSPSETFILSLCNGKYKLSSIKYIFSETFHLEEEAASAYLHKVFEKLKVCLEFNPAPSSIRLRYLPENFIYDPVPIVDNPRGRFETPSEVVFALTKNCNFRCIYCYNSSGKQLEAELTTEQWLDAVHQIKELDVVKCTLTGGEPFLHPGFFQILEELVKNDILPYICTNGSLLDEKAISRIKELSIPLIQISLDSSSQKQHDAFTCSQHTFPVITKAIRQLVHSGIKVYVKAVLLPQNYQNVQSLIDLCHELGVSNLVLDRYDLSFKGRGTNHFFLTSSQEKEVIEMVRQKQEEIGDDMNINLIFGERNWHNQEDIVMCGAFIQSFVILPNGEYAVCEKLEGIPEMSVGNFKTLPIKEMWNSKRIEEIVSPPKEKFIEPCQSCEYLHTCQSGCFAAKLFVTDYFYGPDPKCWKAHYQNNQFITEH